MALKELSSIYFDHAASSPLLDEVADFLDKEQRESFANPSAAHRKGKALGEKIEEARVFICDYLKAQNLIFTSSATEANNTALMSLDWQKGDQIFLHLGDHPSFVAPAQHLQEKFQVQLIHSSEEIGPRTKMALVTLVNSQSSQIFDLNEIEKIKAKNPSITIVADAVAAMGKFSWVQKIFQQYKIDALSMSSHKLGGPKGVGALAFRSSFKVKALLHGGGQEMNLRSSTVPWPLIGAFELALRRQIEKIPQNLEKISFLNQKVREHLKDIPQVEFAFDDKLCSPYILSFLCPPFSSDILLRHMEEKAIILSSTSACSSKKKGPNPTLKALGLDEKRAKWLLRLSFGPQNTLEEVDFAMSNLKQIHKDLSLF